MFNRKFKHIRYFLGAVAGLLLIVFGFVRRARVCAHSGNYVTGIAFHNPNKKLFQKSIKWLKKNKYSFISTNKLIEILNNKSKPPKGAAWITFDDGWRQNIINVIPTIKEHNIPVTFFITSGAVMDSGYFWWKIIDHYKNELRTIYKKNKRDLYHLSERDRQGFLKMFFKNKPMQHIRNAMTIDEVVEISKFEKITIGCHTVNHAILTDCTESEINFEIIESKKKLEKLIKRDIKSFAYPNGKYDERGKKILKQNGINLAATSMNRLIRPQDDILLVPRFTSMDEGYFFENLCHIVGIWEPTVEKIKILIQKWYRKNQN
jgi:peptidoglycan/xylan/chitin deacetylase (PgdA/CDA1 family)